jgi:hypothetical protein
MFLTTNEVDLWGIKIERFLGELLKKVFFDKLH